jgi:hypothetical protein
MSNWHGGKGSKRRNSNEEAYRDNFDKIFGKKVDVKVRKETPEHGKTQVHRDKTKYSRKDFKDKQRELTDLNWDGN